MALEDLIEGFLDQGDLKESISIINNLLSGFDFSGLFSDLTLDQILFKGYIQTPEIEVLGVRVVLRTLLLNELINCWEKASEYKSSEASQIAFRIEYLVYSIVKVNGAPLAMDLLEKQRFKEIHGREPSAVEEARYIIKNKFLQFFIDFLFLVAMKLRNQFEDWFFRNLKESIDKVQKQMATLMRGGKSSEEEKEVNISEDEREAFR